MSSLTDALDRLLLEHERVGSPVPRFLRSGLPPAIAQARIEAVLGIPPHPDLVELFAWHDGIDDERWAHEGAGTGFARMFADAHFAPLDDAIGEYRERLETDVLTARFSMDGTAPITWP